MKLMPLGPAPTGSQPGVEVVRFPTTDGLTLEGRMYPAYSGRPRCTDNPVPGTADPRLSRAVILFCHGVNDNDESPMAIPFSAAGWRVFQFDYRGFHNSDKAERTNVGLAQDALAALRYLRTREDVDPDQIVIYGHSMGGVYAMAAGALACEADTPALAVVSADAFANWREAATEVASIFGLLAGGVDGPEPVEWARRLGKTPLLVVQSRDDEVLSARFGNQIFEAAWAKGVPASLFLYHSGRHFEALSRATPTGMHIVMSQFALDAVLSRQENRVNPWTQPPAVRQPYPDAGNPL